MSWKVNIAVESSLIDMKKMFKPHHNLKNANDICCGEIGALRHRWWE